MAASAKLQKKAPYAPRYGERWGVLIKWHYYSIPATASLSGMSLQPGDTDLTDATYYIVDVVEIAARGSETQGYGERIVQVRAEKSKPWS